MIDIQIKYFNIDTIYGKFKITVDGVSNYSNIFTRYFRGANFNPDFCYNL